MSADSKISEKQKKIKELMSEVDELLKANSDAETDGATRSNEELLAAGKRLDQIADINQQITKLRHDINKLEDKKLFWNKIFKRN